MTSIEPKQRSFRNTDVRYKLEAIRRVRAGESKASVARDLGAPESTLRGWCKNQNKIILLAEQASNEPYNQSYVPMSKRKKKENVKPRNSKSKSSQASVAGTSSSSSQFSPNSENRYSPDSPLDLQVRNRGSTPEVPRVPSAPSHTEGSNREELARLSVELGLNRPEMFNSVPTANASNVSSLSDVTNMNFISAQWTHMINQHNQQVKSMTSPVASNLNVPRTSGGSVINTNNVRISTVSPRAKLPNDTLSVNDSVNCWLNSSTSPQVPLTSSSIVNNYATVASLSTPTTSAGISRSPTSAITPEQGVMLMNWYNSMIASQYANAYSMSSHAPAPAIIPDKPILYQQLTKDKEVHKAEDLPATASLPGDKPESRNIQNTKARAVLDTLLLNSPNVSNDDTTDEAPSHNDAVIYGKKFLSWLESCSEPTITSMQLMQFRSLLNCVVQSAERKNGEVQKKNKCRRK